MHNINVIDGHHATLEGDDAYKYNEISEKYMKRDFLYFSEIVKELNLNFPSVLEIGCGSGLMISELQKKIDGLFFGLDTSKTMLEIAVKNTGNEKVSYHFWENPEFPFNDNFFDLVVSIWGLHHWASKESVFGEIKRVLKPTGILFIVDISNDATAKELDELTQGAPSFLRKKIGELKDNLSSVELSCILNNEKFPSRKEWRENGQFFYIGMR